MLADKRKLSRTWLKFIACASMLTDHICIVFFSGSAAAMGVRLTVGRIAFPIFAYLICEGFLFTRSRKRYFFSVLLLAIISEPAFDLAETGVPLYWGKQNTVFTLLIGLVLIMLMDKCKKNYTLQIVLIAVFGTATYFLHVDYSFWGVICVGAYYLMRNLPAYLAAGVAVTPVTVGYNTFGVYFALIPLFFYDKSRGKIPPVLKYSFYAFYPAHLFILRGIKVLIS